MKRMCNVLGVSRSGYYAWNARPLSTRLKTNAALLAKIQKVHKDHRKTYGSPRIHAALIAGGTRCGVHRVARIMREHGIQAEPYRRMKRRSVYKTTVCADNLLGRQFAVAAPNTVWAADITCFWTGSGWLNLAVIMDLYSRRIVGWAMKGRMTEDLAIHALEMALLNRKPTTSLIHHSDQGSQYQSVALRQRLKESRITPSMSRKGDCYDNAVIESFFKTLKTEIGIEWRFRSHEEARAVIFEYIELFYNKKRIHSTLGYVSPEQFESRKSTELCVH